MKRKVTTLRLLLSAILAVGLTGCIADEVGGIFMQTREVDDLSAGTNLGREVFFQASGLWQASTSESWLEVTPNHGSGGQNAVLVWPAAPNRTRQRRSAQLTIEADGKQQSLTVWQRHDYAIFNQHTFEIGVEGGTVNLTFESNVSKDSLLLSYYPSTWISFEADSLRTRAEEWKGRARTLYVAPNTTPEERMTYFMLVMKEDGRSDYLPLDTAWVRQLASPGVGIPDSLSVAN